jgi:hypothetical protein
MMAAWRFPDPLALKDRLGQGLPAPHNPLGIPEETGPEAGQPCRQLSGHPGLGFVQRWRAMNQCDAHGPQLSHTVAVLPPPFIDTGIRSAQRQSARPVHGGQCGQISSDCPHACGLTGRDGLDLHQRPGAVWPDHRAVRPFLTGLGPSGRQAVISGVSPRADHMPRPATAANTICTQYSCVAPRQARKSSRSGSCQHRSVISPSRARRRAGTSLMPVRYANASYPMLSWQPTQPISRRQMRIFAPRVATYKYTEQAIIK